MTVKYLRVVTTRERGETPSDSRTESRLAIQRHDRYTLLPDVGRPNTVLVEATHKGDAASPGPADQFQNQSLCSTGGKADHDLDDPYGLRWKVISGKIPCIPSCGKRFRWTGGSQHDGL